MDAIILSVYIYHLYHYDNHDDGDDGDDSDDANGDGFVIAIIIFSITTVANIIIFISILLQRLLFCMFL